MSEFHVIVVGAGNAALAASVSAKEHGARDVLVLEKLGRVGGLALTMNARMTSPDANGLCAGGVANRIPRGIVSDHLRNDFGEQQWKQLKNVWS